MFRILSTASALPQCRKTNDDLSTFLDTSDEWISQRTGIRERAVCTNESLTELLSAAGRQALERAGLRADQLDLILCATIRGDYITPSQACIIQKELGASCPAMDISAACTGFMYALDVAAGYFARKRCAMCWFWLVTPCPAWSTGRTVRPVCCLAMQPVRSFWERAMHCALFC